MSAGTGGGGVQPAVKQTPPRTENSTARFQVTYTAQHELFVNSKDVPERELESSLRDALSKVDQKVVVFQGDRKVLLGDMVRILNVAKAAGAGTIAIAAKRATEAELANHASSGG